MLIRFLLQQRSYSNLNIWARYPYQKGTNMRQYLLTDQERKIAQKYLKTGDKLEGFKVLLHRCRNMQVINEDLELIKRFLEKVSE
jgi:hypothetical protein